MRKIILLFCMATSFAAAAQASHASPAASLKQLFNTMQSVEARFNQRLKNEQGQVLEQSTGRFMLKKPMKVYWDIEGKDARLIVSDGKKVWDFDKVLEQVIVQDLSKAQMGAPLLLLTGDAKAIDRTFSVQLLATKNTLCSKQSTHCFVLYPKHKEDQSFEKIAIGFKKDQLQEMQLFDPLGQCSEIIFDHLHLNIHLSDALFQFKIPPQVDVLQND